ncbi:MAG: DUF2207 domain-containing protein [Clostridiales Family XIII bacterium]|nr:DUF2207 domain-containing protein [Clostridiales Family XIII bacterium]
MVMQFSAIAFADEADPGQAPVEVSGEDVDAGQAPVEVSGEVPETTTNEEKDSIIPDSVRNSIALYNQYGYSPFGGFYTDAFDVTATVHKDKTIDIVEIINTNFFEAKHGIYRNIPLMSVVSSNINGKRIDETVSIRITNPDVGKVDPESGEIAWGAYIYNKSMQYGDYIIQIGSSDYSVTGRQIYAIRYTVSFFDDRISAYDSIYYNFLPHDWMTPIEKSTVKVTLPGAETDVSGAEFIAGAFGTVNMELFKKTAPVKDAQKDEVTITATCTQRLAEREGMTFLLVLPDGFFEGEMANTGLYLLIWILIAAPLILLFLTWFIFGRDVRLVDPVEFYPPDNLNPAAIGYLIDGKVDNKDLLAMILFWASKGYLTIEEKEAGKFLLHRTQADISDIDLVTWRLFDALFRRRDTVDISKPNIYLMQALRQARWELKEDYDKSTGGLFSKLSRRLRVIGVFFAVIPLLGYLIWSPLLSTALVGPSVVGRSIMIFFMTLLAGGIVNLIMKFRIISKLKFRLLVVLIPFISSISSALYWFPRRIASGELGPSDFLLPFAAFLSTALCLFLAYHLYKGTDYYTILLGRIKGFKNFLKTAEMDRLKVLFDDDPAYFYNILPYAWVFGLSDKWSEKFKSLAKDPPIWYLGYYGADVFSTDLFSHSLGRYSRKSTGKFSTVPTSAYVGYVFSGIVSSVSVGGGGGGGGSFSSGGGFSGGGSGGGGGGSW